MNNIRSLDRYHLLIGFRIASAFWLLGWYIKIFHMLRWFAVEEFISIEHPLFPHFMTNGSVASFAYLAPLGILGGMFSGKRVPCMMCSLVMLGCSLILMAHIDTYNDATFVTSFWVALWLLWLACHLDRPAEQVAKEAQFLAKCVLGLIFLGGLAGKLNAEYWSGEALYQLYFVQKTNWPYPWLRMNFGESVLMGLANVFSKVTILMEMSLMMAPLYPLKWIAPFSIVTMTMMVLGSTWTLFSVMGCLIGIMAASFYWVRLSRRDSRPEKNGGC